ncbi:MAG: SAM-dependent methyltransferase [uncultured Paraburkholderia sp.]|nr:MAG: SAM-dependent methyltransferase [uncultured Paraburkholderia sp.]CAH2800716.1 MAG: SAM-dependent methyltransferase [uncultured Paraburkholderia sp.]CAH2935728.1 MAG: SAM-dependent methyltransferase [uncultured Paraburkholderia sp.]CAH2937179.1 MAG: SAM-dependent methyltransferase [uncultured Paraburkholderia sp.]
MTEPLSPMRQRSPSAERNREPILAVLRAVLPATGRVLEIASGTGQHAICFAGALPGLDWQPSDADEAARESIAAWIAHDAPPNVRAPLALDVHEADWGVGTLDAVVCINMIHIAPWSAAESLVGGASRHLRDGGVLYLYGPFRRGGAHTAPSNAAFDDQLRSRDPAWGVRDMEEVVALAASAGFVSDEPVAMPANNFSLVFRKRTQTGRAR